MKVYIAGKITGDPDYKEKFAAAEEKLIAAGLKAVNPAAEEGRRPYREWIDRGLSLLAGCDAIYLLPDWPESKGAMLEYSYAKTCDLLIIT